MKQILIRNNSSRLWNKY